jgi:hypothetical protein
MVYQAIFLNSKDTGYKIESKKITAGRYSEHPKAR